MRQINNLINGLSELSPKVIHITDNEEVISKIDLIQNDTEFQNHTLYIGQTSQIKDSIRYFNDKIFFLVSDTDELFLSAEHSNTVITFPREINVEKLWEECSRLLDEQLELLRNSYTLLTASLETHDLSKITEVASKLIQNPIVITDASFKVMAHSKAYQTNDEQWNQNIERGYCSYEDIAGYNNMDGLKKLQDIDGPFIIGCTNSPLRRYLLRLVYQGRHVGLLASIEAATDFGKLNEKLFEHIGDTVARLLYTESTITNNIQNKAYDGIIIDCLNQELTNRNVFFDRMEKSGVNLHSNYCLMVVDIVEYNNYDYMNEHLRHHLESIADNARAISYRDDVILLIDCGSKKSVADIPVAESEYFKENGLKAGYSDVFTDLFQMHKYYKQAKSALKIASHIDPGKVFAGYDEYKFYDMILSGKSANNLNDYLSNKVVQLIDYDEEYNTNYYDTVMTYLECDRKMTEAAKIFDIHKNTMAYRIRKIEEIFDINFDNPMEITSLMYSFSIEKMIRSKLAGE